MTRPSSQYSKLIRLALEEDLGTDGDITTGAIASDGTSISCVVATREDCIVSGVEIAKETFLAVDPTLEVEIMRSDGQAVQKGSALIRVIGAAGSILTAERTALNFLMLMSGIATTTGKFVEAAGGPSSNISILDTRKTYPLLRAISKEAVIHGGGSNHRSGLYDMYLIKDNHIAAAGSVSAAIQAVIDDKKIKNSSKAIEVEVDDIKGFIDALNYPVDVIMLDNFIDAEIEQAIKILDDRGINAQRPLIEVSGNIDIDRIRTLRHMKIDCISTSKITIGTYPIDIGLDRDDQDDQRHQDRQGGRD